MYTLIHDNEPEPGSALDVEASVADTATPPIHVADNLPPDELEHKLMACTEGSGSGVLDIPGTEGPAFAVEPKQPVVCATLAEAKEKAVAVAEAAGKGNLVVESMVAGGRTVVSVPVGALLRVGSDTLRQEKQEIKGSIRASRDAAAKKFLDLLAKGEDIGELTVEAEPHIFRVENSTFGFAVLRIEDGVLIDGSSRLQAYKWRADLSNGSHADETVAVCLRRPSAAGRNEVAIAINRGKPYSRSDSPPSPSVPGAEAVHALLKDSTVGPRIRPFSGGPARDALGPRWSRPALEDAYARLKGEGVREDAWPRFQALLGQTAKVLGASEKGKNVLDGPKSLLILERIAGAKGELPKLADWDLDPQGGVWNGIVRPAFDLAAGVDAAIATLSPTTAPTETTPDAQTALDSSATMAEVAADGIPLTFRPTQTREFERPVGRPNSRHDSGGSSAVATIRPSDRDTVPTAGRRYSQ